MARSTAPILLRTAVRSTAYTPLGLTPKEYTVTLYQGDVLPWCTCPQHRFKPAQRPCKHVKSVQATAWNTDEVKGASAGDQMFVPAAAAGHDEDFLLVLEQVHGPAIPTKTIDVIAEVGKLPDHAKAWRMLNALWEEQAQDWPARYRNEIGEILEESE